MFHATAQDRKNWQQFFEDFSYKPNWEFEFIFEIDYNECKVHITMRVPDSRRPLPEPLALDHMMGKRVVIPVVPITKTLILEPWVNEDRAKSYIRWHTRDMEDHEIDEWFRYKGELVFDPHKEG